MAARSDQTTQIAVIVLSILVVVLLGFTYWFYKTSSDNLQRITELEQQRSSDQDTTRKVQAENESYRQFMGFGQFDNLETVQKQFDEDMQAWGQTYPESERAYRKILVNEVKETDTLANQISQSREREKELQAQLTQLEGEKDAQIKQFEAELNKAKQDAAAERTAFNTARQEIETQREELAKTLEEQRARFDKEVGERDAKITEVETQLATAQKNLEKLKDERERQSETFEVADGRITWVNQANQTAWINLGEADALRRQITFSVFESSETDAGKTEKKGSVEVTRLLGDHMAEVRITDDDPHNPILPGDNIYTPLWHRGKQIHFALTGVIDLDGDGTSDMQQARDLIEMNGGIVDAYVNDQGQQEGEMSIETRYLVLGDHPEQPSQSAERDAWKTMSAQADNLGVEVINLIDFTNRMGYRPLDRTVRMGTGARSADFPPPPEGGANRFRPRTPYQKPAQPGDR